ncbi:tetratricopeptide repeat protein [Dactylosporangium sp. CA-233914]|uniref:CHAT domain-containing tetratricopeptide repeat protein n=1 Tax=Dactylosporangium sp. CA-233914 TaxID=3239934 RepID=UPI003D9438E7
MPMPGWARRVAAARAHWNGERAYRRGDLADAAERLERALRRWRAIDPDDTAVTAILNSLGRIAADRGDTAEAERRFRAALEVESRRDGPDPRTAGAANAEHSLGRLALARDDLDGALARFARARAILAEPDHDPVSRATVLLSIGAVHDARDELDAAAGHIARALDILRETGAPPETLVAALSNLAVVDLRRGRIDEARENLLTALEVTRAARRPAPGATVLLNLGHLETDAGDTAKAQAYLRAALAVREAIAPGSPAVGSVHLGLARAGLAGGDLDDADRHARRAVEIYAATDQTAAHGTCLATLAEVRGAAGDFAEALVLHRRALGLHRRVSPRSEAVANDLNNIGLVYHDTGDLRRAAEYYRQALALQEDTAPESTPTATMRNNLGVVLRALGDDEAALGLYRRAAEWDRRTAPRSPRLATDLNNIAAILVERGEADRALPMLREALDIDLAGAPDSPAAAHSMANLAWALYRTGDLAGALRHARRAVEIDRARAPGSDRLAADLTLLGDLLAAGGDQDAAVATLTEAVATVESVRSRAGDRETALVDRHGTYRLLVGALARRGDAGAAFAYDDRGKARTLRERLGIGPRPETALHARQRELSRRIAAAHRGPGAAPSLREEYDAVTEELAAREAADPAAAPPVPGEVLAAVQAVLADGEVLVSYALAGDSVLAWAVTRSALHEHRLPIGAGRLAVLVDEVTAGYRAGRRGTPPPDAVRELSAALLVPVPDDARRLTVVPDGRLAYLPFELLTWCGGPVAARLVTGYAPSATVLAELRRRPPSAAPRAFAGFGDPLLTAADGTAALLPSGRRLRPLPGAGAELDTLAVLFGADGERHAGAAATEAAVRRRAPAHRLVHFATHGLLDDADPLYSGLVLTPPGPGDDPSAGGDDLLQVYEMADLGLDADLVVCSACQTGLGTVRAGEGPIGMARGLLSAGARSVVLSLWPVPDLATRRLMVALYEHLRAGIAPAEALHRTRAALLRDGSPLVWAAFVLVGAGGDSG